MLKNIAAIFMAAWLAACVSQSPEVSPKADVGPQSHGRLGAGTVTVPQLPPATLPFSGTEAMWGEQNGSKQISVSQVATAIASVPNSAAVPPAQFLGGPTSGAPGAYSFRSLAQTDLPLTSPSTTGSFIVNDCVAVSSIGPPVVVKDVACSAGGGVASFNTRTGAVTLSGSDVTTALGFTPAAGLTSVGLALPGSVFNISGSPVTGAGTLTGAFANQTQNTIFAGTSSGAPTSPTFRTMVEADLPATTGLTDVTKTWNSTQGSCVNSLTFGATVTPVFGSTGCNISTLSLTGNVTTLANPTGTITGVCGVIKVKQPAAGGPFTISGYGTAWKFPGGTHPTYSTAANAVDALAFCGTATGELLTNFAGNYQ